MGFEKRSVGRPATLGGLLAGLEEGSPSTL